MKIALLVGLAVIVSLSIGYGMFFKNNPLQERAKRFLEMPIPEGMAYVEDSIAERFIVEYANSGSVQLDSEMNELLQIVVMESEITEGAEPGTEEAFMNESAEILQQIVNEVSR
jgi:hypothetical protein